jgi:hypothetical protein
LSITLARALRAVLVPVAVLAPLGLVLFFAFSRAVNGDIGRLSVGALQQLLQSPLGVMGRWDERVPQGDVAPEQTRWLLLFSLVLLIAYAVLLGATRLISLALVLVPRADTAHAASVSRSPIDLACALHLADAVRQGIGCPSPPVHAPHANEPAAQAATSSSTTRDAAHRVANSYGSTRPHMPAPAPAPAPALRLLDPFIVCPVPLNQLFDVLEIAHGAAWLARRFNLPRAAQWERRIERGADMAAVLFLGPACWLMHVLSPRPWTWTGMRGRRE